MQEPLRSQYLAALGIDNYVPRFILPGAKLSQPCAWSELFDEPAPAAASTAAFGAESSQAESQPKSAVQRAPVIESTVKRTAQKGANVSAANTNAEVEAGPQFALSIVLAAGGILLIDAAPASSAERSDYQKLLGNMLPALRPAAAQYVLDIFLWPLTRQPKIARDADAAKETLAAFLQKQIQQRAIDTVLLLGATAQQWCTLSEGDVRIVRSTSLLACVQDPALKRPLWNDIRHLAER